MSCIACLWPLTYWVLHLVSFSMIFLGLPGFDSHCNLAYSCHWSAFFLCLPLPHLPVPRRPVQSDSIVFIIAHRMSWNNQLAFRPMWATHYLQSHSDTFFCSSQTRRGAGRRRASAREQPLSASWRSLQLEPFLIYLPWAHHYAALIVL